MQEAYSTHPLIGHWSVDCLYAPGAQEDTLLMFKPDGTGWIEFAHYVACEVHTFNWQPLTDGSIAIRGERYYNRDEERPSDFTFENLLFTITEEQPPLRPPCPVVTFAQPLWFSEQRWRLLTRNIDQLSLPQTRPLSP